jgi:acetylornithine deacetylase
VTSFEPDAIRSLLARLVAIDSVNPSLVPGAAGEAAIADFVVETLAAAGLEASLQEAAPGRPNAIGFLKGLGGGRSLMLNAHTDTVGLGGMEDPLTVRVEGDRAYGRGAYDMKGSLAAILLAVGRLAQGPKLRGDVVVTAVADEEHGSLGTRRVLAELGADVAVVTEPTGLDVCIAHKGFAWIEIETEGRAAHGSKPEEGRDAIVMMGDVLGELKKLQQMLAARPPHPLLTTASLHASLIQGGHELSSYPARCLLQIERHTLPGESAADVAAELAEVLRVAKVRDADFQASANVFFWRDPYETDRDSEVVSEMVEAAQHVLGHEPEVVGATWWMDSALSGAAGIPTVIFGPGGGGAHSDEEWVSVSSIDQCAQVLVELAQRVCG